MTETEACLALNLVPNLGPVKLRKLLAVFGEPERILLARKDELRAVEGIGPELAGALAEWRERIDLEGELKKIQEFGARLITRQSPEYPEQLRQIHNPPIVLYVWGDLQERDRHAVGVVGSRQCSHYGLDCAKRISYQLAFAGLTVISGLARGIDTAAHQAALAAQGRTVAVIGSGLAELYPPENRGLAEKIATSGAVVSEFPMGYRPNPQTFPYRNRIVAGWGDGVLVVEASLKSGALITANQALEHGRMVYAVPGPIDRPTSAGGNRLIQQGAKLVTSAADILEDLQVLLPPEKPALARAREEPALSEDEQAILAAFGSGECSLEQLAGVSGLPAPRVSGVLLILEMKRRVQQLPGHLFVKVTA